MEVALSADLRPENIEDVCIPTTKRASLPSLYTGKDDRRMMVTSFGQVRVHTMVAVPPTPRRTG